MDTWVKRVFFHFMAVLIIASGNFADEGWLDAGLDAEYNDRERTLNVEFSFGNRKLLRSR